MWLNAYKSFLMTVPSPCTPWDMQEGRMSETSSKLLVVSRAEADEVCGSPSGYQVAPKRIQTGLSLIVLAVRWLVFVNVLSMSLIDIAILGRDVSTEMISFDQSLDPP